MSSRVRSKLSFLQTIKNYSRPIPITMATPLFLKALEVNEKLTVYYKLVSPPLRWDPIRHEYWHDVCWFKKLFWYLFYIIVLWGLWPCATFYVLLKGLLNKNAVEPAHLIITFMQGVFWAVAFGFYAFFNVHTEGVASFLTQAFQYFWRHCVDRDVFMKSQQSYFILVKTELLNFCEGTDTDFLGIIANAMIPTLVIIPSMLTITLIWTRIDPFAFAIYYAYPARREELMSSYSVALFTNGISFLCALETCNILRHVLLPLLTAIHQYRNFIHFLDRSSRNDLLRSIKIYRDFYLLHLRNREFTGPCIQLLMGVGFVAAVVNSSLTVAGYRILPVYIYWFEPVCSIWALLAILNTLPYATYVYDFSTRILVRWHEEVSLEWRYRHLRRRVKTYKPLCFYCGSIGVLKKESKTLYLTGIFNYTVNFIMFIRKY